MEQEESKSLLRTISDAINDGVLPRDFSLSPDPDARIMFADGASDGIALYHMGTPEITDEIREAIKTAVYAASNEEHKRAAELFCALGRKISAIRAIDALQSFIIDNRNSLDAENLFNFAFYVIFTSTNHECLKFGMSIMALFNIENNKGLMSVIAILSMCNEFTIFAIFIMQKWSDANSYIFSLATHVYGWGRIHAVEHIKPETDEIKKWLLHEGINNDVLPAYSALTCWEKSGAAEQLHSPDLSIKDFKAIARLIDALLDEGPCPGISAIENHTKVLAEFLNIAQNRMLSIDEYVIIRNIRVKFEDENPEVVTKCNEILNTENCRVRVRNAEKSGSVIPLAKELGIDFKDEVIQLLEMDFDKNFYLCGELMDDKYRAKTLDIFREKLPFDRIIKADKLPIGEDFQIHNQLSAIVYNLRDCPLEGVDFIEFSLRCGVVRHRSDALSTLQSWVNLRKMPLETLLPEMFANISHRIRIEPDDDVREKMEKLLNGEIDE